MIIELLLVVQLIKFINLNWEVKTMLTKMQTIDKMFSKLLVLRSVGMLSPTTHMKMSSDVRLMFASIGTMKEIDETTIFKSDKFLDRNLGMVKSTFRNSVMGILIGELLNPEKTARQAVELAKRISSEPLPLMETN